MGFSVVYERPEAGFAFIALGNAQIMLDEIGIGRTWRTGKLVPPLGRGVNLQIEVEDLSFIMKKLKGSKVKPFLQVEEKWYRKADVEVGNKQLIVQDPDGYLLRFFQNLGGRRPAA